MLGGTDGKGAMVLAERLRTAVEQHAEAESRLPDDTSILTASLGVAAAMPDREGAWQDIELIASAERALAQAREAGRNTVIAGYTRLGRPLVGTSFAPFRSMFALLRKRA